MPQIDVSSFLNQVFFFFLVFFFLFNFIAQKFLLNLTLTFRMRKYNPLKFINWRKSLWFSVHALFVNNTNRCWFIFYTYYQEFIQINFSSLFWLNSILLSSDFLFLQNYLLTSSILLVNQTYNFNSLFGDFENLKIQ